MKIELTEKQVWFIKCAIEAKDSVLPLHPNTLDDKIFEEDYGFTKNENEKEISDLRESILELKNNK
jgi:hypothetical protein